LIRLQLPGPVDFFCSSRFLPSVADDAFYPEPAVFERIWNLLRGSCALGFLSSLSIISPLFCGLFFPSCRVFGFSDAAWGVPLRDSFFGVSRIFVPQEAFFHIFSRLTPSRFLFSCAFPPPHPKLILRWPFSTFIPHVT